MEVIHSDDSKVIISENNCLYTFLKLPKEKWILALYEEPRIEGKIEISALYDDTGSYTKLAIKQNKIIRILTLCDNRILSDIMYDCCKPNPMNEAYVAYIANSKNKKPIPIDIYFSVNRAHSSDKGNSLVAENLSNSKINHFLEANEKLNPNIKSTHKIRIKEKDD